MGIVKTSQKCKTALESDGLVLFLGVAHGVSHMDGHWVSLEAGLGLGHGGSQLQSSL